MVTGSPAITVVIPVYNQEDTICAAIESVLAQTLPPIEVIVIDDGSRDGTVERVRALTHPSISVVSNAVNIGAAACRNIGISRARGEWLAFLDADDRWRENKLWQQWSAIQTEPNSICFTNLEFFGGNERRQLWNVRPPLLGERMSDYMIVHGQAVQTSTLFMKSAVARRVRFDRRLRRHQDWDFILRAEQLGLSFCYLANPLTLYDLSNPNSLSRNVDPAPSLAWMTLVGPLLDRRARATIELKIIIPRLAKQSQLTALTALAQTLKRGGFSPRQFIRAVIRTARG